MSTWLIILVTAGASYWLSLIVRVLTSREKKIEYQIEHLFSIADEQFLRSVNQKHQEPNIQQTHTTA